MDALRALTSPRWRTLLVAILLATTVSCGGDGSDMPSLQEVNRKEGLDRFKTAVSVAQASGYTPYWLGPGFEAGGLTFTGPATSEQRVLSATTYTQVTYADESGGDSGLYVQSLSIAAWRQDRERIEDPDGTGEQLVKPVQIAGRDATLYVFGPILWVVVEFDRAVVVAIVRGPDMPAPPGSRTNPLLDEATLLGVLDELRPYPD